MNDVDNAERVGKALEIAHQYSQYDGAHHKDWCIDQEGIAP